MSVLASVMTWPLTENVWPWMSLSSRAVSRLVVAAGAAVRRVVPVPLVSTLDEASCVTSRLNVPFVDVPSEVAVPIVVLESVAVCAVKRVVLPSACSAVLRLPRLVPRSPRSVLCFSRLVSVVSRFVIGMLSAAITAEMIDETFSPLNSPPIVTLIR